MQRFDRFVWPDKWESVGPFWLHEVLQMQCAALSVFLLRNPTDERSPKKGRVVVFPRPLAKNYSSSLDLLSRPRNQFSAGPLPFLPCSFATKEYEEGPERKATGRCSCSETRYQRNVENQTKKFGGSRSGRKDTSSTSYCWLFLNATPRFAMNSDDNLNRAGPINSEITARRNVIRLLCRLKYFSTMRGCIEFVK